MFENPEIGIDALPKVDAVTWRGLDDKFVRRKLADAAITIMIIVGGVTAVQIFSSIRAADLTTKPSFGWLWTVAALLAILLLTWPPISVPKMGYAVRDKDILFKSGVFWRTITAIPLNRVQHVEKSSTPLDRRFRLASVKIFTAGGAGGDLTIHGLPAKVAEKLRTYILERVGSDIEKK